MTPGVLTHVVPTSCLYGPVQLRGDGSLGHGEMIDNFRNLSPAIVVSLVEVWVPWRHVPLPMVYLLTPTQIGWTWKENTSGLEVDAP